MKQIGAVIAGCLCLSVAAVHAADGDRDLSMEPFRASITAAKEVAAKQAVQWVAVNGGKFVLGTPDFGNAQPIPDRSIEISNFEMSKTLVTVGQYRECVIQGACTKPDPGSYCNYEKTGREDHPVNCVNWFQTQRYAAFEGGKPGSAGARLPSESEWEYAARSGGKNRKYPWGDEAATCEKAVMSGLAGVGCGNDGTMPVCSKPESELGLCDMVGQVWQWVQDTYQSSYARTPTDGKAYEGAGPYRVMRGGSFRDSDAGRLRADYRLIVSSDYSYYLGFRLARDSSR